MTEKEKEFYRQLVAYYLLQRQKETDDTKIKELNEILNGLYNLLYGKE